MLKVISIVFVISFCLAFGQILLKMSFEKNDFNFGFTNLNFQQINKTFFSSYFLSAIIILIIAVILWFFVISENVQLSLIYPLLSISYIIMAVLAYFLLGEELSLQKIVGICIVCIGITIIMWGYKFPLR